DYDTDGAVLNLQTTDTVDHPEYGGNDTITITGDGNNHILGGMGSDAITEQSGTGVILGDNGIVTYAGATGSLELSQIVSTVPSQGSESGLVSGDDVIVTGDGDKHIIAGYGSDTVTAGTGDHVVFGDAGQADYDTDGAVLNLQTTDTVDHPEYGGDDRITSGDGNNLILAGMGADTVTEGNGTGVILGDNGTILYEGPTGNLQISQVVSTLPSSGGGDTLTSGSGDKYVIAGVGADTVATGSGNDIILGDNGIILSGPDGIVDLVQSTSPTIGAADVVTAGEGNNILIGGTGADRMSSGSGKDILLGDGGQVTFSAGMLLYIETIDNFIGGNDFLDGGPNEDILFGGAGNNTFVGTLADDVMVGSYGRVTFEGGAVDMVIRLDSTDIIANTMTDLQGGKSAVRDMVPEAVYGEDDEEWGTGLVGEDAQYAAFYPENRGYESVGTGGVAGSGMMERGTPGVLSASNNHHGDDLSEERGEAGPSVMEPEEQPAAGETEARAPREEMIEGQPSGSSGERPAASSQAEDQLVEEPSGLDEGGTKSDPNAGNTGGIDSAAGKAIAGLMGWKIISGGDLDKSSIVNTKSFERLAKKQEDKRYKRWKNAGSWQ
ncbi:MAG TPA: hypothetical protein PLD71_04855, partial [Syntrophales bacterium]|nr:hypothetical protein [Syntrophales bacterium]